MKANDAGLPVPGRANMVLQAIKRREYAIAREICDDTGIPRSTVNRYLLWLYKKGLVRRSLIEDQTFFGTYLYAALEYNNEP